MERGEILWSHRNAEWFTFVLDFWWTVNEKSKSWANQEWLAGEVSEHMAAKGA